jgi:exopolyphosphatase
MSRTNYCNVRSDLDSLASAIAYAWYATCYLEQPTVPLLQTSRADLSLRPENLYALEFSGIDPAHLLTGDELPADSPPAGKYALLDHNALTGRFAAHENMRVIAIVDHHEDEKCHPEASPRIVESPTGSCSSLIGRLIQKEWDAGMSRSVARLLLCAVLIDTGGLKAGGKAEVTDREVAPFLLEKAELVTDAGTIVDVHDVKEAKELTRILTTRKTSVDLLSPRDLLRRDYKEYRFVPSWTAERSFLVGLASVPRRIKAITRGDRKGRQELATACAAWIKEKGLNMLGVLTSWKDEGKGSKKGKHRREMLWVVREDEEVEERFWKGLEGSAELELERKESRMEEAAGRDLKMRLYEQGDGQATRKVIAPLVRAIIEKNK